MSDWLPVPTNSGPPAEQGYPGYPGYGGFTPTPTSSGMGAQIQRYLTFLRRFWWIPVLTFLLAAGGATAYILHLEPTYTSRAAMWETEKLRLPEGAMFSGDGQSQLANQIELLRSGKIGSLALDRLRANGTNNVPADAEGKPLPAKINVFQASRSTILALESSSANAAFSQAYLDAVMTEFLAYKKNIRKVVSGDTLASISSQVLRLEAELKADQAAFAAFQRTNNLAILEEEGRVAGGYLARLKTQISDLNLEAQLLEATAREQTNTGALPVDATSTTTGSSNAATTERQTASRELELLKLQRDRLSKYLRPKHPKIVRLDNDIQRAQKLLEIFREQNREQLAAARQAVRLKIQNVDASIREWESKVTQSNALISEAERLRSSINRAQTLYDRLALMLQNVDISRNIDQETLTILSPAGPAIRSFKDEKSAAGMALFLGLAIGLLIVLLIARLNDRLTSLAEVTDKVSDNVVGQVPEIKNPSRLLPLTPLQENDDRHVFAESYRSLRSAIYFLPNDAERPKVILVTSALPEEGKSTVSSNLAHTLALGGARVLLVDGDLRKGHLHDLNGLKAEPGFADVLQNPGLMDGAIQVDSIPKLRFMGRGKAIGSPGDLFLRSELTQLLDRWRKDFDYVIIDSCPVFAADDAVSLAPKVDGVLFVVRNEFSRAGVARKALEMLAQRQARILGIVLNRANASGKSYQYYKYGDYHKAAKEE